MDCLDDAVVAEALIKHYSRTKALDGLDLRVSPGEVHALVGPNGAGKTTALRILAGLARPNGGMVTVLGRDPWVEHRDLGREVAYVPGDVALWPNLTGGEAIQVVVRSRGGADPGLCRRLITDFELDPRRLARTYSKGNRQKVALVAAFARPAKVYLLDEPASGLDPLMVEVLHDEVERVRADGAAVLISSHQLAEVEVVAHRVSLVRQGRVFRTGTLAELRTRTRSHVRIATAGTTEALDRHPAVHDLHRMGAVTTFDLDVDEVGGVLQVLASLDVRDLSIIPASLEEVFVRSFTGDLSPTDLAAIRA